MLRHHLRRVVMIVFLAAASLFPAAVPSQTTTAYFLVAIPSLYRMGWGDSYVLPLSDSEDIAFAGDIIAAGGFKIVSAVITVGADGINRDMLAPGTPEWSWHVTEFLGFGDYAAEYCDGRPTYTEGEVQHWSEGEVGVICYASYTVVAEIAEPVPCHLSTWGKIKACFRE